MKSRLSSNIDSVTAVQPQAGIILYHPKLGPVRAEVREVSDDTDAQVAATIGLMRQYAHEDKNSPAVHTALADARRASPGAPTEQSIWKWVKRRSKFQLDPATSAPIESAITATLGKWRPCIEVLIRPRHFIEWKTGDCDDYSMLVSSLLLAAGLACTFVTIAADSAAPRQFTHVCVAAYRPHGNQRLRTTVDASHGPYCGWQARGTRVKEWIV